MSRIFLLFMCLISTVGLTACNRASADRPAQPHEISAITQPFFEAVRRGDQKAAEKFVAPGFLDDSKVQFAEMSALLKKSPRLEPVFQQRQGTGLYLTYAAQDGENWITAEIRVVRNRDKQLIEYWDVNAAEKPPELVAHAQSMKNIVNYGVMAIAICALFGLALLIWLVRNRTHLVAPVQVDETRRVAATVRHSDN